VSAEHAALTDVVRSECQDMLAAACIVEESVGAGGATGLIIAFPQLGGLCHGYRRAA